MKYKLLGRSGLRVSELCLGTMTFGKEWGWGSTKDESREVYDMFVQAGGNFVDTANLYTNGTSEEYVGEFSRSERERMVLATKYTLSMDKSDPNKSGNHRKNMVQAVDASLKRLKTDYIDLYWLHAWDYLTPVDEVMRALDDLIRAGKVLYIGISDTPAWIVSRANTLAELMGWTQFVGLQIKYSLIDRTVERELLPMARSFDMTVTPWATVGSGLLTGKLTRPELIAKRGDHRLSNTEAGKGNLVDKNITIAKELDRVADEIGRSSSQTAINWVRQQPGNIIPILGARNGEQLKDNLGCLNFELTAEQIGQLNEISHIDLGFPHDFLKEKNIKEIIYGEFHDKIDNHRT